MRADVSVVVVDLLVLYRLFYLHPQTCTCLSGLGGSIVVLVNSGRIDSYR